MPSYNLNLPYPPSFPPSSQQSRHRPVPLVLSPRSNASPHPHRHPAPSAALVKSPTSPSSRNSPAWTQGSPYYRSPLALSSSTEPEEKVASRLREHHYLQYSQKAPSRRYLRPPPKSASATIQEFQILPKVGQEGKAEKQREALFEELVARTLDRRLREKLMRSKVGEKAGLGVSAGREMAMLAALGRVREGKKKAAQRDPPMSAPPGRQTFSLESTPLRQSPPPSVLLQRALSHRKSSSSSAVTAVQHQRAPSLDTIRGFIARRSSSNGAHNLRPVQEEIADEKVQEVVIDLSQIDNFASEDKELSPKLRMTTEKPGQKLKKKRRTAAPLALELVPTIQEEPETLPPVVEIYLPPISASPSSTASDSSPTSVTVVERQISLSPPGRQVPASRVPASAPPASLSFSSASHPHRRQVLDGSSTSRTPRPPSSLSLPSPPPRAAQPPPKPRRQSFTHDLPALPPPIRSRAATTSFSQNQYHSSATPREKYKSLSTSRDPSPYSGDRSQGEFKPIRDSNLGRSALRLVCALPSPLSPIATVSSAMTNRCEMDWRSRCGTEEKRNQGSYAVAKFAWT